MRMYTLYKSPRDYPEMVIIRGLTMVPGVPPGMPGKVVMDGQPMVNEPSIEKAVAAFKAMPQSRGMVWVSRHHNDEPHIMGVWL